MSETVKLVTRREFMKQGLTLAAASATVPTFLARSLFAIQNPSHAAEVRYRPGVPEERVLVVIQLGGGNDGLNTVIPYRNDIYYQLRPTLAIAKEEVLDLNGELGVHPGLSAFKELYETGRLAIIQGVGYPNPDRSHFRSMEIWQSGVVDGFETTGWIGRLFDHTCDNAHLNECSPTLGVSVGQTLNPAFRAEHGVGVAVANPERLYRMTRLFAASHATGLEVPKDPERQETTALDFLRRTAVNAQLSADRIRRSVRQVQTHTDYPQNPFAQGLKLMAGMIAGGLDTRVYYISLSGFDTHASQAGVHQRLLKMLSDSIAAFQKDLENLGQGERVLGMVFSEFGRRVAENGSRGTDHGQAAPMFIFGKPVRAGFLGQHPSLEKLSDGDLQFGTDFRSVYASVLEDWLRVEAEAVLGSRFEKIAIV
ncbi:MAG: DUF1501 domain-containing protein [bacterium]